MKKKILICLLYDYYLFDYWAPLSLRLLSSGYSVTIQVLDRSTFEMVKSRLPEASVIQCSNSLRWASNRSGSVIGRIILWILAWLSAARLSREYDFAIVPWDYRVIWHTISCSLPSLTIHNTTDFIDIDLKLERLVINDVQSQKFSHKILAFLFFHFSQGILPHVDGKFLKYKWTWFVDRLMGYRGSNGLQGFSGIKYMAVTGHKISDNYKYLGVGVNGSKTRIFVVGNPNYENLHDLYKQFDDDARKQFVRSIGLSSTQKIVSFFVSPSFYTQDQLIEIFECVSLVYYKFKDHQIVLKCHPKTVLSSVDRLHEVMSPFKDRCKIITAFQGDEWNAKLVLSSSFLVQKQSTVGFIAMIFGVPILSYDHYRTGYDDNMYEIIKGSIHSKNIKEFERNLELVLSDAAVSNLRTMQDIACENYCLKVPSPCVLIQKLIDDHFSESRI